MTVRAIFGGSFDPPHVAHVLAVDHVLEAGLADIVMVIPVFRHAFDKDMTPFDVRLSLVHAAFAGRPHVEVSDIERELPAPSYTVRTLEALRARYPDDELRLLVGSDLLSDTPRWHRYEDIIRMAPPIVLGRVGFPSPEAAPAVLPAISSSAIRAWLAKPEDPEAQRALEWALPRAVRLEIAARGLYRQS